MENVSGLVAVLATLILTGVGGAGMYLLLAWMFGWDKDLDLDIEEDNLDT